MTTEQHSNMTWLNRLLDAARLTHEAVRAYSATHGDEVYYQWRYSSTELKASVLQGLFAVLRNPGTSPRESHENWSRTRIADGWVWGPVKDMDVKTHPCLVPYEDLPEHQRFKDDLFLQCARNCIAAYRLKDIEDLDAMYSVVAAYLADLTLSET